MLPVLGGQCCEKAPLAGALGGDMGEASGAKCRDNTDHASRPPVNNRKGFVIGWPLSLQGDGARRTVTPA